ncbi:Protein O-linked-mannose beta-1 4-N-acetylglucosaminyltransferase 2, partial [Bienertia sinuspersici]
MEKSLQTSHERHIHSTNIPQEPTSYNPKTKNNNISFNYSAKHSILILLIFLTTFLFFQIPSLQYPPSIESIKIDKTKTPSKHVRSTAEKLRQGVTFLPLKDLRYASVAQQGHTWFMSSMNDTHEEGEVYYQKFPSNASNGRILCIKGHDSHDGSWNYYALAWLEALPHNATLMKGLTFVSYNHYNYDNMWHGLSAVFPFVSWHMKNGCKLPSRWVLYHWGELRVKMSHWLSLVLQATFDGPINIEGFEGVGDEQPVCYEEAVVMRHNYGGMSRQRRMETYDEMRCKARIFCNVSEDINESNEIGMTLLMRTGPRSFKNDAAVIDIFKSECGKVNNCRLFVAYANNLTFCEQVELMSLTDILLSPHGAQLTNMFLMNRNSSIMEFFPKGWLKLAGVGQYVYQFLASWSGMKHQGFYRDINGEHCPYSEDDPRCMSFYKSSQIGHNDTYFREWSRIVLNEVKIRKMEQASNKSLSSKTNMDCTCRQ